MEVSILYNLLSCQPFHLKLFHKTALNVPSKFQGHAEGGSKEFQEFSTEIVSIEIKQTKASVLVGKHRHSTKYINYNGGCVQLFPYSHLAK